MPVERLSLYLLCPTPGLGSEVIICSYDLAAETEKLRTTVGRDVCLMKREAIGLIPLNVLILRTGSCTFQFPTFLPLLGEFR